MGSHCGTPQAVVENFSLFDQARVARWFLSIHLALTIEEQSQTDPLDRDRDRDLSSNRAICWSVALLADHSSDHISPKLRQKERISDLMPTFDSIFLLLFISMPFKGMPAFDADRIGLNFMGLYQVLMLKFKWDFMEFSNFLCQSPAIKLTFQGNWERERVIYEK